jgi:amidohydrolase family protein
VKKSTCRSLGFCLAFLLGIFPSPSLAQAQQPAALVIEGGTLIDGNGGAPVRDSVVVIQGNKITNVSRKGQASYPANAQVIKADGKFVLPGLIDAQVSYSWPFGEAMLINGVTSTIDIGNGAEVTIPHREGVLLGKIRGPRTFTSISHINGVPEPRWSTGFESALTPAHVPKSAPETRELVKRVISAGADYLNFQDGSLPMELYRAGFEEAAKAGKAVLTRPYGPILFPKEAALLGSAGLTHSAGVPASIGKDSFMKGREDDSELDLFAEMDDAKAKELIQILVEHKTALVPNFVMQYPGYPKDWARFEAESRKMFSDPSLLAYYPADMLESVLGSFGRGDRGAVRERRIKGYQNALRFHKMLVDAGGHLVAGGNTNSTKTPGLNLHHEMQIFAEAGVAPMQIIQGATKWAAEMIRKQDQVGTIEAGKLADVIIVNEDPLQSVNNLEKIDTVIFDGRVVDRTYHSWYSTPFLSIANGGSPTVDGLPWVAAMKSVFFRKGGEGGEGGGARPAAAGLPNPALSPQPAIESVDPVMVTEGGPALTLTIKGFNFVRKSAVYFNGRSVPYRAASARELQVTLDADLLQTPGRFDIIVKNPEPIGTDPLWGNGTSNKAHLLVNYKH